MTTTRSTLLIIFVLLLSFIIAPSLEAHLNKPEKCVEDMACWNCETMGNKICGPNYERNTSDND